MILTTIKCFKRGDLRIEVKNIDHLFSLQKGHYIKNFRLSEKKFSAMAKFKKSRGGYLIEIFSNNDVLAMFTLSFGIDNFLELGDVMKLDRDLPRKSFARAMDESTKHIISNEKKSGAYSYPNKFAVSLEKIAGYREYSRYVRNISFIFLGYILLLPVQVTQGKLRLEKDYLNKKIIRKGLNLVPTRLSFLCINIYKKTTSLNNISNRFIIGFLYEFTLTQDYGDFFLLYGNKSFDHSRIGFEFGDNSA